MNMTYNFGPKPSLREIKAFPPPPCFTEEEGLQCVLTDRILENIKGSLHFTSKESGHRSFAVFRYIPQYNLRKLALKEELICSLAKISPEDIKTTALPLVIATALLEQAKFNYELFCQNLDTLKNQSLLDANWIYNLLQMADDYPENKRHDKAQGIEAMLIALLKAMQEDRLHNKSIITQSIVRLIEIEHTATKEDISTILHHYVAVIIDVAKANKEPIHPSVMQAITKRWSVEALHPMFIFLLKNGYIRDIQKLLPSFSLEDSTALLNYRPEHSRETILEYMAKELKNEPEPRPALIKMVQLFIQHGASDYGNLPEDDEITALFRENILVAATLRAKRPTKV